MATAAPQTPVIELARTFQAPREKVFEAWTRPELMQRWLCRTTPEAAVKVTALDLRPGGGYRLEVDGSSGKHYSLAGEYREVQPAERLVFTWQWVHEPGDPVSLVTVELLSTGSSTEVRLRHEGLAEAVCEGHRSGWKACFDRLAQEMSWSPRSPRNPVPAYEEAAMGTIQQVVEFSAAPAMLFELYMDSAKHSAATSAPARISAEVPGEFSAFGGGLRGKMLLVEPGRRIVQSWRAEIWKDEDPDSVLVLTFSGDAQRGRVELAHIGVPEHALDTIRDGWSKHYWQPWKAFLASASA